MRRVGALEASDARRRRVRYSNNRRDVDVGKKKPGAIAPERNRNDSTRANGNATSRIYIKLNWQHWRIIWFCETKNQPHAHREVNGINKRLIMMIFCY